MKNTIYCFSGTGTAMSVAKKIKEEYKETEIIPIPEQISKCYANKSSIVGLIFPIHGLGLPRVIKKVINQIQFYQVEYIYAIATMGENYGIAFQQLDKLLKKRGKNLSSSFALSFGGNSNLFLKIGISPMLSTDVQLEKHDIAMNQVLSIVETIRLRRLVHVSEVKGKAKLVAKLANIGFSISLPKYDKHFKTEGCIKCEKCITSCPNQNIVMSNDGPQWKGNCEACLRCFNICSEKAVLYGDMGDPRMNERFTQYIKEVGGN